MLLQLDGYGLVRVHSGNFDLWRVRLVKVTVVVDRTDASRSAYTQDNVKRRGPLETSFQILQEPVTELRDISTI